MKLTRNGGVDAAVFDEIYKSRNPLVRWYFFKLLKTAVEMADLREGDYVLDFGCNKQRLKQFLPDNITYVGYDIDKRFSDVEGYRKVKPDVVFAVNTFEHLTSSELEGALKYFYKIGVREIIVGNPTSNLLSEIAKLLTGIYWYVADSHALGFYEVIAELHLAGWNEVKSKTILTFNRVGKWIKV